MAMAEGRIGEDAAMLDRIAQRDPEGVSVLYDRYSGVAFAIAYRILGDPGAAEDVVQEAFLNVWRRAVTYDPQRGTAKTWLLSIVHHQAIDAFRTRRAQGGTTADIETYRTFAATDDTATTAIASADEERVRGILAILPPKQRLVIDLAYFDGLTQTEIAAYLGLPLGTVKGRMRLALEKLRGVLVPPSDDPD